MRRFFLVTICLGIFGGMFFCGHDAFAQQQDKPSFPTPNTMTGAKPDPKKQGVKEKRIRYIITNDTRNTLSGNRCFEEATMQMGFQYLAIPKGQPLNKNGFSRWWHNLGVKFMIMLKNGPWWKSRVNKKYKDCMYGTGDYVG